MSDAEPASRVPSKTRAGFLTAFGLASIAGMLAMPLLAGPPSEEAVSQWGRYFGRLHPVLLHLPIGMLSLLLLMEFGKLFRKDKGSSTLVPAFFTAASAILAVIVGFLLYQSGGYGGELVQGHLWWGIGFACAMVASFIVKSWVDLAGGRGNFLYVLMLVGSAVVMTVASHDGGSITHGKEFLREEEPDELRDLVNRIPGIEPLPLRGGDEGEQDENLDGENAEPVVPVVDQIVYTHIIQPIFDQKCVSCHGEEKQKGKLRMDSYEATLAGGKEGDGFEPGSAEDSNIVFRIHLPEDDEEHMPPEGKKQIEAHELAILEWWIDSGASPDLRLADAEVSEDIRVALSAIAPASESETSDAPDEVASGRGEAEAAEREKLAEVVEGIRGDFPSALNFESRDSAALTFTAVSMRKDFSDADLVKLAPVMGSIVSMDLSATAITDTGLKQLADAGRLRLLRLSETAISDPALDAISGLRELESLNLYGTSVTTAGVAKLTGLPKLKRLYLWQTAIDPAGLEELRRAMPGCEIVTGG